MLSTPSLAAWTKGRVLSAVKGVAPLHRSGCDKAAQREYFQLISRRAFVHCHEIV